MTHCTGKAVRVNNNTTNKDGLITHYIDLEVQTKGVHRIIQFLVMNIGNKDLILGYPWLTTFKPQFNWASAVINEKCYLSSFNQRTPGYWVKTLS